MAGLLYKDFVGIRGKVLLSVMSGCTLLLLLFRMAFPGDETLPVLFGLTERMGEEFYDIFLLMLVMTCCAVCAFLPSAWTTGICKNDEKSKARQFVDALPMDRNSYIASKYLFIGILVYVLFSMEMIWSVIYTSAAGENSATHISILLTPMILMSAGVAILIASVELPFFLSIGVARGRLVKTAFLEILFFLVVAYLLFGDLNLLEHFDVEFFVEWCESHTFALDLFMIIGPAVILLLYGLSYGLTCRINRNREVQTDV